MYVCAPCSATTRRVVTSWYDDFGRSAELEATGMAPVAPATLSDISLVTLVLMRVTLDDDDFISFPVRVFPIESRTSIILPSRITDFGNLLRNCACVRGFLRCVGAVFSGSEGGAEERIKCMGKLMVESETISL